MGRNAAGLGYVVDLGYVVFFGAGVTTGPALVLVDRLVDVAADFLALAVADVGLIVNCGIAAAAVAWPSGDEETARVTEARRGRPESRSQDSGSKQPARACLPIPRRNEQVPGEAPRRPSGCAEFRRRWSGSCRSRAR
jgi:hypothetical protein